MWVVTKETFFMTRCFCTITNDLLLCVYIKDSNAECARTLHVARGGTHTFMLRAHGTHTFMLRATVLTPLCCVRRYSHLYVACDGTHTFNVVRDGTHTFMLRATVTYVPRHRFPPAS